MANRTNNPAYIIQVHKADAIGFTTLAVDTYVTLFRHIDESTVLNMNFRKSEQFSVSSSNNVAGISNKLKKALFGNRKKKYYALLLEMLDKDADVDAYDDLCEAVYLAIDDTSTYKPWCVCIAISNGSAFQESVLLKHRLLPVCDKHNVALILLARTEKTIEPSILCRGRLPKLKDIPALKTPGYGRGHEEIRLSPEEIAEAFQVLFDHFKIRINGMVFHVPAIASVRKLAKTTAFITQLGTDISRVLGSRSFNIYPFGIPSGGIGELALALANGDASRLCDLATIKHHRNLPLVILCDFISPMYPIQHVIEEAMSSGIETAAVAGIASYQNAPEINGAEKISYINTKYKAYPDGDPSCEFCRQDVPIIEGEHFEDYARKVGQFEAFTFWDFLSQEKSFVRSGHWASNRTPNHYEFRIMTAPIFQRFSYCLALRLRNILVSKGISPAFVRKIVCTEGEESTALSNALVDVLGLRTDDVIQIPRKFFASIAGKELGTDLQKYIDSEYGTETFRKQNVLIVDQAAHHFKTMSSLRYICEFYDCVVLAFLVFVDRTDIALSLGEYLLDSHYVALYSWPVTPRRSHECPCTLG